MRHPSPRLQAFLILIFTTCLPLFALENTDKIISAAPVSNVQWQPASHSLTYVRPTPKGPALFSYDLDSSSEKTLVESSVLALDGKRLSLQGLRWSPKGDALLLRGEKDLWWLLAPVAVPRRLTQDALDEAAASISPDGSHVAFTKQNNLFVVSTSGGEPKKLTTDGSDTILNATLDWVYEEELRDANPSGRAYCWSPDSKWIAYLKLDQSKVPEHPIVDILQTHPTVNKQRYPKSGDANSTASVCYVGVDGADRNEFKPTTAEYIMPEFTWSPDSKRIAFTTLNRAQDNASIHLWKVGELVEPPVMEDSALAWVNVFDAPHFLKDGSFIKLSERDGWMHAYLFAADGKLIRQITKGNWMIEPNQSHRFSGMPYEVDAAEEWIYFSATEKDPRERHIYRARIDGTGTLERLTKEDGTHFQKLSPDGKFVLESFSSDRQPPMTRILKPDGSIAAILQRSGPAIANAPGEYHELNADDGTKLYARMTKPANFDAAKKYPVLINVYGGPQFQNVRNVWEYHDGVDQRLARDGYIIWSLDNRGSWGRGHAFETAIHKNMGAKELADQLAGVEYLKKLPYVDGARIGIHGWSYGGYMTLYSLTHAPDVFKCGAAGAPVTDWKYYDSIYTERYMSTPKDNPQGYITSSPLAAGGKLKAKLLIIHGTSDDNVHIQNTMNFIDALTKSLRPYELQIQPGQRHGFSGEKANQFLSERMIDFFKRNL